MEHVVLYCYEERCRQAAYSQAPPPPHPHSPSGGVIQHWRTPPTPAPPNLRPTSAACCCRCHCRCAAACYRCKHCGTHHFHPLTLAAVADAGGCRRFLLHLQRRRSTLSLSPLHGNGHPPPPSRLMPPVQSRSCESSERRAV